MNCQPIDNCSCSPHIPLGDIAGEASVELRDRLAARLAGVEADLEELFSRAGEENLSSAERKSLFRVLGSYRGLSEAEIGAAQLAERTNWAQWHKSRF